MRISSENIHQGYIAAFGSALLLSLTSIFISYLNIHYKIPALVLAFWREFFVAILLLIGFTIFKSKIYKGLREHIIYLIAYGFVLALFNALWTISVILNGAAVGTVLAYCSAAFTVLLGWLILKETLTFSKVIAVILSLLGCALIVNAFDSSAWDINAVGMITGVLAGLFYAFYSLMGRSASQRGLNPWKTLFYIFSIAAVFMLFFNLFLGRYIPGGAEKVTEMFWLGDSIKGWGILFLLAAGPTLMGYGLYNVALNHLQSSVANLIATIEPVFTAATAYFVLGEVLSFWQILGSLLVIFGVFIIRLSPKRHV